MNTETTTMKADFYRQLSRHDWAYSFSDDHSVWRRGEAVSSALAMTAKSDPGLMPMYLMFCNWCRDHMNGKPAPMPTLSECEAAQ